MRRPDVAATVDDSSDTTTGVLGGDWRAKVSAWGAVRPPHGAVLDWHISADDRWHTPNVEAAVRQRRLDGTPVVETRLRIPGGDAVQRVWSVPDAGGLTIVEVANDSPLPIAVAFTRRDLLSTRVPTTTSIQGIDLTSDAVAFPIGHHAAVTVAMAHDGRGPGPLPPDLPAADAVVRGWLRYCAGAGRIAVPDEALNTDVVMARSELALTGPGDPDDAVTFLLGVDQLVRLGEPPDRWAAEINAAAEVVVREVARRRGQRTIRRPRPPSTRRTPASAWSSVAALDAAARLAHVGDDRRALHDLAAARVLLGTAGAVRHEPAGAPNSGADEGSVPATPSAVLRVAATETRLADAAGRLLVAGLPTAWLGGTVEVHDLPIGLGATVSYALRWHGPRPAVLWEVGLDDRGDGRAITLTSPVLAPGWSTTRSSGEALWPAPSGESPEATIAATPGGAIDGHDGDVSFG